MSLQVLPLLLVNEMDAIIAYKDDVFNFERVFILLCDKEVVSQRLCPHVFLISKTPRSLDFGLNSFNQNYKGRLCPPTYIKVAIGV